MLFANTSNKKSKPKPTLNKGALNLHNVKLKHSLSERKCKCKVGNYHLDNDNEIMCEDGNKLLACTCALCKSTICKCVACRTNRNLHCNRHSANRHRRKKHAIVTDVKCNKVNDIDEINLNEEIDENLALSNGFNNVDDKELMEMEFVSDLHNETINYRDFIRHIQHKTEKKYLASMSQDRKFTQTRSNNVMHCDVLLQLKLTKLCSELSPIQQLELGKTLDLTMQSNDARKEIYA